MVLFSISKRRLAFRLTQYQWLFSPSPSPYPQLLQLKGFLYPSFVFPYNPAILVQKISLPGASPLTPLSSLILSSEDRLTDFRFCLGWILNDLITFFLLPFFIW